MQTALTIAGSDCSGGAGIQADIKTMTMNGVYAMTAITSLTAQNTQGVFAIQETSPDFLSKQIDSIVTDIFPDAVKTGMLASKDLIEVIVQKIKQYKLKNIVVDPVMVSTSGSKLINDDAIEILKKELFPLSTLITPNIPEAECILENKLYITNENDMEKAAKEIYEQYGCSVLLKGGHSVNDANDCLYGNISGEIKTHWFYGKRINNPNTHGTGCTLSSAIASNLAKGLSLEDSIEKAKDYLSEALKAMLNLGKGRGPLMHNFKLVNNL
ncbi:MAG: bifunctional hydroxymethylpyrimidine kinase/phosphomethylpyrimidine kinase [Treponema sp.]|nr:bifunctional hydroxymethylpyrimidine kinase/phosphomethylpyrimidine kinase [Treponema sp.]